MAPRPTGSLRERRPGVWEIRVAHGTDPVTGRTVQRSITFRGTAGEARVRCDELAAACAARRDSARAAPFATVGELLDRWLPAEHDWKPSTWVGYRSNARALSGYALSRERAEALTPHLVRLAMTRWAAAGATTSVTSGRFRTLRAALGWAYDERILDRHPLHAMRGPPRPEPRSHVPPDAVRALLRTAQEHVDKAAADADGSPRGLTRLHRAEQDLLLVRLAADAAARGGELAALRIDDLPGAVLTIARAASMDQVGRTKTGRPNRLTLSPTTAALWHRLTVGWRDRLPGDTALGPWLFSARADHSTRFTTVALGHRFARLRDAAGVDAASLHRVRHSVATFLVGNGQLLKAQARLGHRDPSTTLRNYSHAMPLDDADVAEALEALLDLGS